MSARVIDENGFITINKNPISRSGVFQYLARSVDPAHPEPNSIINVYRPDEELADPEAINSFKLIPIVDDHTMLGDREGSTPAEQKGVHGTTGDEIVFENGVLKAKIKLFSQTLRDMIQNGKKDLSLGYSCEYTKSSGTTTDGQSYEYIQRKMRGNHLALVDQARCNVAVLDGKPTHNIAFDHFDLALTEDEKKEFIMADEDKKKEKEEKEAMDARMRKVCDWAEKCMEKDSAEEEKKKKEGEDKAAKDAAEEEEKKKKAEDAAKGKDESEKAKEEEKKAMDEAIKTVAADVATLKSGAFVKGMLTHVNERNAMVERVSRYTGAFDAADKTLGEVVAYGIEKLKIEAPKGQELATLTGYLNGMDKMQDNRRVTIDGNSSGGGKTDAFLKQFDAA